MKAGMAPGRMTLRTSSPRSTSRTWSRFPDTPDRPLQLGLFQCRRSHTQALSPRQGTRLECGAGCRLVEDLRQEPGADGPEYESVRRLGNFREPAGRREAVFRLA